MTVITLYSRLLKTILVLNFVFSFFFLLRLLIVVLNCFLTEQKLRFKI